VAPQQQLGDRRARLVVRMAAKDGLEGKKKKNNGGGLGFFLRRTLGGALAVVGLGAAPLRRETLDLLKESPAETMQQLVGATLG
jgi:hypothetical protein